MVSLPGIGVTMALPAASYCDVAETVELVSSFAALKVLVSVATPLLNVSQLPSARAKNI